MRAFLLLGIALLTVAAAGCGGDDEATVADGTTDRQPTAGVTETTTEAPAPTTTTERDEPATTAEDDGGDRTTPAETEAQEPSGGDDSGGGNSGGGNSGGGGAASGADKQAAQDTALTFLRALAGGDGAKACDAMTDQIREQVEKGLSRAPGFKGKGCPDILAMVAENYSDQVRRSITDIQVLAVTVNGETASVSYKAGALPKAEMPLVRVDGEWRVGALTTPGQSG